MRRVIVAVIMVMTLIGCGLGSAQPLEKYQLGALFNDKETNGSFFLGCGSINEHEYIFAWISYYGGPWTRLRLDMRDARIICDENENPYVIANRSGKDYLGSYSGATWYFHVPQNTIIRKYELK